MYALFDGAEVFKCENFQATRNKLAAELTAHIFLGVCNHILTCPCDASGIVIKLDARGEIAGVFFKLSRGTAIVE